MLPKTSCKVALVDREQIGSTSALRVAIVDEPGNDDLRWVSPLAKIERLEDRTAPATVTLYPLLVGTSVGTSSVQRATRRQIPLMVLSSLLEQIAPGKSHETLRIHFLQSINSFFILYT